MSRKKILHITYDMRIGGTEMVIKNIIEGANTDLLNMSIFCIEQPLGPWGVDLKKEGISVASIARKDGFDFSVVTRLRALIKYQKIDVVHCHQYTPWVYGAAAAFGTKAKVIFTEHGRFHPDSSSWKRRIVNPILALVTYKITAISHATRQALSNYEFLSSRGIEVIYNGIQGLIADEDKVLDIKQSLNIQEGEFVFGTIARLDPIKNHRMMLNAFSSTLKSMPTAKLIIVGDGELMDTLKSLIDKLNISNNVILTGYIPYPKDYLAVFDIFLLSSLSEGTSMTLLEAMSLSKPCIVTDAGGNKEIVTNKETGLVSDNDNMQQFSDAMLTLAKDVSTTAEYGLAAKQRFDAKFDVTHMTAGYQRLYDAERFAMEFTI
jgi:glycosyltransferase involved in cell wall biosynthesis